MSLNLKPSNKLNAMSIAAQQFQYCPTGFDALPNSAYIREAQLVQSAKRPNSTAPLPFSAPTLWRMVKAGTFPQPVKFSSRVTCWNVGSVREWLAAQAALKYNPTQVVKVSEVLTEHKATLRGQ